ncbi:glucosaminidase domain-containing protein [Echinicola shivajiensis]|uniref:glucosaminidase domain-containing protein n=1 Tax=Echinicola shivajiensis TaxID=1035916 RepID=UPI001BFC2EDB|nr:glucosaminidase domain-containing protein [Echinicola shivajiensis]
MRIKKLFLPLIAISILFACNQSERKNNIDLVKPELNNQVNDTLIYSDPKNYLMVLDGVKDSSEVKISSYKELLALFEKLNYTQEAWQAGIREVPRVYLQIIGEKWGSTSSKEVSIDNKKRIFFRGLAPLLLRSNELIKEDQSKLKSFIQAHSQNEELSNNDHKWIIKLAKVYQVDLTNDQLTVSTLEELSKKVDIIPVSLALAQAAEESGWGTSRFAAEGNSLYGQWSWGENAITPENQRKGLGNYGIAAFETLQQSVCAYMLNLNTHNAYSSFRNKRNELRKESKKLSGYELAGQLTKYSERGEDYVKTIRGLMDYNHLIATDSAYLSNSSPIYLIPKKEKQ